jgi:predicted lipoprotein with Yx(FWY)xxD motif
MFMLHSGLWSIMELKRRTFLGATALTVGFAGCLGGDGGSGSDATTPSGASSTTDMATTSAATTPAATESPETIRTAGTTGTTGTTVQVYSHPDLGDVLVGPDRMTLYMFDSDTEGESASTCSGDCAGAWPPLTVTGSPSAGDDVTAQLATFDRESGDTQVLAGGWPLYYFASDEQPGDAKGQGVDGFGAQWWVLSPDGSPMRAAATTTGGSNTSTGGGGSGGGGPY